MDWNTLWRCAIKATEALQRIANNLEEINRKLPEILENEPDERVQAPGLESL